MIRFCPILQKNYIILSLFLSYFPGKTSKVAKNQEEAVERDQGTPLPGPVLQPLPAFL